MAPPRTHDAALRVQLLDKAGQLLSGSGPEALSLRRLAGEADTSTTAVYSLFGGKPGLIRELYIEGFRRLGDRLERVPRTDDPLADLAALGHAYRASALANRHFYSIMFGNAIPTFTPDEAAREESQRCMRPLEETIERAIAAGFFVPVAAEEIVFAAWSLVHGLVSLELADCAPPDADRDALYERALRNGLAGWLR